MHAAAVAACALLVLAASPLTSYHLPSPSYHWHLVPGLT
jgi:hypothetical protein